jgi:Flp pilus assembly protein TadG
VTRATRRRRGATALELGLTLPVFLALLFALLDVSWWLWQQANLDHAARAGCRAAAQVNAGPGGAALGDAQTVASATVEATLAAARAPCEGGCTVDVVFEGDAPVRAATCTVTRTLDPLVGLAVRPRAQVARASAWLEWQ